MPSPWEEIDRIRKAHDGLVSWLKTHHGAWTLQDATGDGHYVARRRASKERPPMQVRAKTVEKLQQLILQTEESDVDKKVKCPAEVLR